MTSRERIRKALLKKKVDRIPVVNIFNPSFLNKSLNLHGDVIGSYLKDPLGTVIELQEGLRHDPIINLYNFGEPGIITWPSAYLKWEEEDQKSWIIEEKVLEYDKRRKPIIERRYHTPRGDLKSVYKKDSFQKWVIEPILKDDSDYSLLEYRPDPEKLDLSIVKRLLDTVGDRAFSIVDISGCFQEYCRYRSATSAMYDLNDCPDRVKSVLEIIKNYNVKLARRYAQIGVDAILLNESHVGLGISGKCFDEFVMPFDTEIVSAAKDAGLIVSFHICGKSNIHLERMTETGTDAIEVLAPPEVSGDVNLGDAKRRVGEKVGLWGGFNERLLYGTSREVVKKEVFRCLEAAGKYGGYILRGSGQIYNAVPEAWDAYFEAYDEWHDHHF